MSQLSGLTVRQHERETLALRVEFVVCDKHREQVRYSSISTAPEPHVTQGTALDVSPGGMGVSSRHFVPRMCEGTVRVFNPKPAATAADGSPIYDVIFDHPVKVRRVTLESHEPTYALGLAFIDPAPDIEAQVATLLELAATIKSPEAKGDADG